MQSLYKLCNIVYWLALSFWLSVLVSVAIAASNTFAVLKEMDISIERYSEFVSEAHSNLVAGHVLEPIFWITNAVQFVVVPIVLLTLALQLLVFKLRKRLVSNIIRTACIVIASGLFAYHAFVVVPSMNRDLHSYWNSAEVGDIPAAISHREGFQTLHPTAETILSSTLLLIVIATIASAATMTPSIEKQKAPNLQTPKLAGNI